MDEMPIQCSWEACDEAHFLIVRCQTLDRTGFAQLQDKIDETDLLHVSTIGTLPQQST
jgi:hypothetical protein